MHRSLLTISLALFAATSPVFAGGLELTPFLGYRLGGDFDNSTEFFDFGLEVDDSEAYGLTLGIDLNRKLQLEFFWSHQESTLIEQGFFFEDSILFDLDVDYYHVGILYQWSPGQLRPFVTASLGGTTFSPEGSLSDESRFSMALGGGVKFMANEHFGVRLEGRGFATLVDEGEDNFYCDDYCYSDDDNAYFTQFEGRAGLVFHF